MKTDIVEKLKALHACDEAVDYDVRKQVLKQCADIVRKHYPNPPEL